MRKLRGVNTFLPSDSFLRNEGFGFSQGVNPNHPLTNFSARKLTAFYDTLITPMQPIKAIFFLTELTEYNPPPQVHTSRRDDILVDIKDNIFH